MPVRKKTVLERALATGSSCHDLLRARAGVPGELKAFVAEGA